MTADPQQPNANSGEPPIDRTRVASGTTGGGVPRGSAPPPPVSDPLLGKELGGCVIEALLGRGAMGAVYRAKQVRLDREVAVKVIRPELLADQRMLKRFEQEARTVGRFNSPHVVMVHDVGFELGVHFLVMEFVKGKNLREHTKLLAGGRLSVSEALPLLRQACKGLEEAQRMKVLHRDIKPDNLMLTERGVLKIADFGIAKPMQEDFSMTLTSELIGTPLYMSPEQCQAAADLDFRSDMYSLGATFYYLLTGEPPVRASSVYELIQTKTKLEHLCLWKALPDLGEDHPLSRVVERMTALARNDRYPSYEALLDDLALVEQGRTMDIRPVRPKAGATSTSTKRPAPPTAAKPGRSKALPIAVVAVLLAGGGGAAYWATRATPGGGTAVVVDAAERLKVLRQQFAESGPSQGLRDELARLPAEPTKDAVLADVDQGLAVKAKLQGLQALSELKLPLDDLAAHLAAADAATAVTGAPGAELAAWLGRVRLEARAEATLGAKAEALLVGTFRTWREARLKAGGDKTRIAELGVELEQLEVAHARLQTLLPGHQAALLRALPLHELATARSELAKPVVVAVDVGKALADARAKYVLDGPLESVLDQIKDLQPTLPAQVAEQGKLLNEVRAAADVLKRGADVYADLPAEPQLPFADVAAYYGALDRVFQELRRPESGLPDWAARELTRWRDTANLRPKVVARCRDVWRAWQQRRELLSGLPSMVELEKLEADLRVIEQGFTRARELFDGVATELDAIATAVDFTEAGASIGGAKSRLLWLVQMRETSSKVLAVATLVEWRAQQARLLEEVKARRAAAGGFAASTEVAAELRKAEAVVERWQKADERVAAVAKALGAGDLAATDVALQAGLEGEEGRAELQLLGECGRLAGAAFSTLEREVELARTLAQLEEAAKVVEPVASLFRPVVDRLTQWRGAVQDLQGKTAGMAPIPAGRTKDGTYVAGFFLSRTEATQATFQAFLEGVAAAVAGAGEDVEGQRRLLRERLGELVPPPEVLIRMLGRRGKLVAPELPIEDVSWYEAAACAAWSRQALPTASEWALAAFGDQHQHDWPWGGKDWKDQAEFRNIGDALVPAAQGGAAWRSEVRHLAGNVAEWLATSANAAEALLAGGSYRDNDVPRDCKRRAAGEEFGRAALKKSLPGFGFRTVLRPQEHLAPLFARGHYPGRK